MANEVELERMIVRLVGDASRYERTLLAAIQMTEEYGKKVKGFAEVEATVKKDAERKYIDYVAALMVEKEAMGKSTAEMEMARAGQIAAWKTFQDARQFAELVEKYGKEEKLSNEAVEYIIRNREKVLANAITVSAAEQQANQENLQKIRQQHVVTLEEMAKRDIERASVTAREEIRLKQETAKWFQTIAIENKLFDEATSAEAVKKRTDNLSTERAAYAEAARERYIQEVALAHETYKQAEEAALQKVRLTTTVTAQVLAAYQQESLAATASALQQVTSAEQRALFVIGSLESHQQAEVKFYADKAKAEQDALDASKKLEQDAATEKAKIAAEALEQKAKLEEAFVEVQRAASYRGNDLILLQEEMRRKAADATLAHVNATKDLEIAGAAGAITESIKLAEQKEAAENAARAIKNLGIIDSVIAEETAAREILRIALMNNTARTALEEERYKLLNVMRMAELNSGWDALQGYALRQQAITALEIYDQKMKYAEFEALRAQEEQNRLNTEKNLASMQRDFLDQKMREKVAAEANDLQRQIQASVAEANLAQETAAKVRKAQEEKAKAATVAAQEMGKEWAKAYKQMQGGAKFIGAKFDLAGAFESFANLENAQIRLTAAIEAGGHAVESTMQGYNRFADSIAATTTQGRAATLGFLEQAEAMGISGEAAERVTKNAMALAGPRQNSLMTLRMAIALEEGNTTMLLRQMPVLRKIKDETERAAKAKEILSHKMKILEADASSSQGQILQLKNAYNGFKAEIGAVVAQAVNPLVQALKWVVDALRSMPTWLKTIITVVAILATAFGALTTITALYASTTVVAMRAALAAAAASVKATLIMMANPAVLLWVATLVVAGTLLYALEEKIFGLVRKTKEYNDELAKNVKLQEDIKIALEKQTTQEIRDIKKLPDLHAQIEAQEELIRETEKRIKLDAEIGRNLQAQLDIVNTRNAAIKRGEVAGESWEVSTKELEAELQDLENRFKSGKDSLKAYEANLEKLLEPQKKLKEEIESATHALGDQSMNLMFQGDKLKEGYDGIDMTSEKMGRYKLQMKGATEAQLEQYDSQMKGIHAMKLWLRETEKPFKANEAVKEFTKSIREQIEVFGMSSNQAALFKLQKANPSNTLAMFHAKSAVMEMHALEERKSKLEKAAQVTEQFTDPSIKLARHQKEVEDMFASGAISIDTYTAAMKEAAKTTDNAKVSMDALVRSGSADALARIAEYTSVLRGDGKPTTPKLKTREQILAERGPANEGGFFGDVIKKATGRDDEAKKWQAAVLETLLKIAGVPGFKILGADLE